MGASSPAALDSHWLLGLYFSDQRRKHKEEEETGEEEEAGDGKRDPAGSEEDTTSREESARFLFFASRCGTSLHHLCHTV